MNKSKSLLATVSQRAVWHSLGAWLLTSHQKNHCFTDTQFTYCRIDELRCIGIISCASHSCWGKQFGGHWWLLTFYHERAGRGNILYEKWISTPFWQGYTNQCFTIVQTDCSAHSTKDGIFVIGRRRASKAICIPTTLYVCHSREGGVVLSLRQFSFTGVKSADCILVEEVDANHLLAMRCILTSYASAKLRNLRIALTYYIIHTPFLLRSAREVIAYEEWRHSLNEQLFWENESRGKFLQVGRESLPNLCMFFR